MKPTIEQISNALALKGTERPNPEYWQEFICEFHQRQREQTVRKSRLTGFICFMSGWFSDLGPSKWAYAAGVAYAAVTVAFFLTPQKVVTEGMPASHATFEVVPAPTPAATQQLKELDLSPLIQGAEGEQVF